MLAAISIVLRLQHRSLFVCSRQRLTGGKVYHLAKKATRFTHDAFDHHKRQNLQFGRILSTFFEFSSRFYPFSLGFLCNSGRKSTRPEIWRKLPDLRTEKKAQNLVTSVAFMV